MLNPSYLFSFPSLREPSGSHQLSFSFISLPLTIPQHSLLSQPCRHRHRHPSLCYTHCCGPLCRVSFSLSPPRSASPSTVSSSLRGTAHRSNFVSLSQLEVALLPPNPQPLGKLFLPFLFSYCRIKFEHLSICLF